MTRLGCQVGVPSSEILRSVAGSIQNQELILLSAQFLAFSSVFGVVLWLVQRPPDVYY